MSDWNADRRKITRRKLMAFTPVYEIFGLHPRLLLGYLGDLTLKGALINTTKPVPIDKQIKLGIEFPSDLPDINTLYVEIPARVARCQQEEGSDNFGVGVEFTEVTFEQAELFQQILARYHFRHTPR